MVGRFEVVRSVRTLLSGRGLLRWTLNWWSLMLIGLQKAAAAMVWGRSGQSGRAGRFILRPSTREAIAVLRVSNAAAVIQEGLCEAREDSERVRTAKKKRARSVARPNAQQEEDEHTAHNVGNIRKKEANTTDIYSIVAEAIQLDWNPPPYGWTV